MASPSGIRWPEDLKEEIERARIEDCRSTITDEVVYLVRLGLEEREYQRQAIARDKAARRGGPSDIRERRAASE